MSNKEIVIPKSVIALRDQLLARGFLTSFSPYFAKYPADVKLDETYLSTLPVEIHLNKTIAVFHELKTDNILSVSIYTPSAVAPAKFYFEQQGEKFKFAALSDGSDDHEVLDAETLGEALDYLQTGEPLSAERLIQGRMPKTASRELDTLRMKELLGIKDEEPTIDTDAMENLEEEEFVDEQPEV